jgi:signal recognition particle subunit SRP54
MFTGLTKNITKAFENFKGKKTINEQDVEAAISDIRMALLEADVSLEIVKEFCEHVTQKAVGQEVVKNVSAVETFVKIVQDEITNILSDDNQEISLPTGKNVIMMVGLQGSGKTTSTVKLAKLLTKKHNKKVLVASTDIYRPAAREQLEIFAKEAEIDSLEIVTKEKPEKITKRALKTLKKSDYDTLIIDTAGRLSIDEALIKELKTIKKMSSPAETFLVADSLTGQDAVTTARNFNDEVAISGLILTRIDGDQRGGAALSMKSAVNVPIKFIGVGEKIDDLDSFKPERIASRILDMGDIVSLVEKAQEVINEDEAKEASEKFISGNFDLDDMLKQIKNMKKMGGFKSVLKLIPGAGQIQEAMKNANVDEKEIAHQEAIILSMTKKERQTPDKLNTSRKRRIASGSGTSIQLVNRLLKKFKNMQKMMKKLKGQDPNQMMDMLNNMGGQ